MKKLQQDIMCVLLQTLLDKNLIAQDARDKAREKILGTLDCPKFFCYAENDGKEDQDGHT